MIQLLKDRVAIVAAHSRPAVLSTARLFLQHGACVAIAGDCSGISEESLGAPQTQWKVINADMSDPVEARYCVADTLSHFSQVDTFFYYPSTQVNDFHVLSSPARSVSVAESARDLWSQIASTLPIFRHRQQGNLVVVSEGVQTTDGADIKNIHTDDYHIDVGVINTMQTYHPKRYQQHTSYQQLTPERIARLALSMIVKGKQQETEWNEILDWSSEYLDTAS